MRANPLIINWHDQSQPIYSAHFEPAGKGRLATAAGDNNVRVRRPPLRAYHHQADLLSSCGRSRSMEKTAKSSTSQLLRSTAKLSMWFGGRPRVWPPFHLQLPHASATTTRKNEYSNANMCLQVKLLPQLETMATLSYGSPPRTTQIPPLAPTASTTRKVGVLSICAAPLAQRSTTWPGLPTAPTSLLGAWTTWLAYTTLQQVLWSAKSPSTTTMSRAWHGILSTSTSLLSPPTVQCTYMHSRRKMATTR